jgi:hypothetical protein
MGEGDARGSCRARREGGSVVQRYRGHWQVAHQV